MKYHPYNHIFSLFIQKKEQVSQDYENPNELPNPVVKSSRRPLRTLKNSQKDKTAVEASKPSKTDRRLTKVRKMPK